ncbi:hypothetical protein SXANM310S_02611 [Streptomyces xanthochromogenes]
MIRAWFWTIFWSRATTSGRDCDLWAYCGAVELANVELMVVFRYFLPPFFARP